MLAFFLFMLSKTVYFVALHLQFIEPCKQLEWDSNETDIFLGSLVDTCGKLDSLHR